MERKQTRGPQLGREGSTPSARTMES